MRKLALALVLSLLASGSTFAAEEKIAFGRFGTVTLYRQTAQPQHVVLFVSGDGGWNLGVVDMARELTALDALVVGVDITHYLKQLSAADEKCSYPAADFEALSQFVQKRLNYAQYVTPVLVGYSSGATLVYAALAQAPPNTFRGAISLGFCPDLWLTRPMCRGSGLSWRTGSKGHGYIFEPATHLEVPWVALQGEIDQVCSPRTTGAFVKQVRNGKIVSLPRVGHGFAVPRNWMPQFKQAFAQIAARNIAGSTAVATKELSSLPLIEVPAAAPGTDLLAVHLTGDGGWGVTDRGLAEQLAAHGIPVVGLSSLQYFWNRRTPESAAADLERIIRHYLTAWNKRNLILIGYSFGADVLPFLVNRLPRDIQDRIQLLTFLGLGSQADFQFHFADWFGTFAHPQSLAVGPEVEKLKGKRMLCVYGSHDEDALCKTLPAGLVRTLVLGGGHRIGSHFEPITEAILRELESTPASPQTPGALGKLVRLSCSWRKP